MGSPFNFKIKNVLTSYLKLAYNTLVKNPPTNFQNYKLNFETTSRILAYHCAHVSYRHKGTVKFDSDAVEAILDSGCSTSISFEENDFINYKPMAGKVEGLGIHKIRGTGTLKYTVLDDNGDKVNLLIKDAIHVPTMDVRLISIQQIAQQSKDPLAGGDVRADACYLRWNGLLKTVPYQTGSNLPILYTLPGGKIAQTYIAKHTHALRLNTKAYFLHSGETYLSWDKSLIHSNDNPMEVAEQKPSNLNQKSILKPGKNYKENPQSEDNINLSICGDCTMESAQKKAKPCTDCAISFENLTQPSRVMLHYHNKLDHMGFDAMRALARRGFLPKCIIRANAIKCAACQAGKAHIKAANKDGRLIKQTIINPGDLIHMDQAQSSTPGRPLTYSGRNNKQKVYFVTIFVDSISKKVFCEFQHSTGAKETVLAKQAMEREAATSGVKIKSFRADNGIFKSAEFRLELQDNAQNVTFCGVGAHHQNGIAERYIRTMVEKARTVLLNAHARWPDMIDMELWTFAFRHVVTKWNNTPRPDLEFKKPDEVFNGVP